MSGKDYNGPSAADIATSIIWWQGLTDFLTKTVTSELKHQQQKRDIREYENGFLPCTRCGAAMVYLQNYCTNCGLKRG
jgi:hypothetical protein